MTRVFVATRRDRDSIAAMFRAALPGFEVVTGPDGFGGQGVPYVVVDVPVPGEVAAVPGLQVVLSLWAGVEKLLASGEVPDPIPVVRLADDGLRQGMVEWVLGHVLAWHRNFAQYRAAQARRDWAPLAERLAQDRVVTVLGAGALGGAVARHLVAIGFQTRTWSRTGRGVDGAAAFAGAAGLVPAVAGAEIVVNLLPLTPETADRLDARVFAAMARGGLVINGARGGHVVEADLLAALDAGQLGGAVLDVFRHEPLPAGDPFWTHPGVTVSPHVAAPTHLGSAVREVAANILRHQAGAPMLNVVDRRAGY